MIEIDLGTGVRVRVDGGVDEGADKLPLGAAVVGQGGFAARKVVKLPWTAAASDAGRLAVWIFDPASGAVQMRPVAAEAFDNETLILSAGLSGGEKVVQIYRLVGSMKVADAEVKDPRAEVGASIVRNGDAGRHMRESGGG